MTRRSNRNTKRGNRKPDAVGQYFGDAWSLAKRTATGLNEIRKLINIEEKILDTVQGSATFDTTGNLYSVSTVAQGTDYNTRIGNSIKIQHIEVRWRCYKNSAASQTIARVLLVRDLDGYGTAPTTADILQNVGAATAPTAPHDWLNRKRFSVIRDEFLTLNNTGDSTECGVWSLEHAGHILYLGTTATAASNGKGSLYVLVVSDEAVNTPSISFTARIVFTDD